MLTPWLGDFWVFPLAVLLWTVGTSCVAKGLWFPLDYAVGGVLGKFAWYCHIWDLGPIWV
jgi:hypothetical protein